MSFKLPHPNVPLQMFEHLIATYEVSSIFRSPPKLTPQGKFLSGILIKIRKEDTGASDSIVRGPL